MDISKVDERYQEPYSHPRFWWSWSYIPTCFYCTNFQGSIKGKPRCSAFPDGIPRELFKDGAIHDKPYEGDHGIRFEKMKEEKWEDVMKRVRGE